MFIYIITKGKAKGQEGQGTLVCKRKSNSGLQVWVYLLCS